MKNNKLFSKLILNWYKKNKRDLPWRNTKDPYKIWVSEIILQQTQISQGTKYYFNFIEKFPDLKTLSKSTESDVLKIWEGLGYYSRAINMLNNAKLLKKHNRDFPNNYNELIELKGIGDYTAAAISSICKDEKKAVLDGNVFRVISRVFNISAPINKPSGKKIFQEIIYKLLPTKKIGDYNQGLMDFGSIHCTIKSPKCNDCPVNIVCKSYKLKNIESRPVKIKTQAVKKIRNLNYFIIEFKKNIYIQKRLENDIWKNLYELPLLESKKKITKQIIEKFLSSNFRITEIVDCVFLKKINHKLSHQNLNIFFWKISTKKIKLQNEGKLLKTRLKSVLNYPFPKPISKYLNEYLFT